MIQTRITLALALMVVFGMSLGVQAQTKQEAADLYNKGAQLAKSNPGVAAKNFVEVVEITKKIGPDAYDLQQQAEKQIANLQYKQAINLYKEKKYDEAVDAFNKAAEYGEKYNDGKTKTKAEKIVPKLHYVVGIKNYKQKEFAKAIDRFDKAIELSPNYPKAYFGKGLVYKKLGKLDEMKKAMDETIEVANTVNDSKTAQKASKTVSNKLLVEANQAVQRKNWSKAENYLDQSMNYGSDHSKAHILYMTIYNNQSQWDKTIQHGEKLLSSVSDEEAKSKVYFDMATAYQGKGDNAQACSYFSKVTKGDIKAQAQQQMKAIKCN